MAAQRNAPQPGAQSSGGFFRTLWRVLRQVFHESTGAMFLILALFWSAAAVRQWMRGASPWMWMALGGFALILISFGVSSFRAARRVR
jgi:hypothetical protein